MDQIKKLAEQTILAIAPEFKQRNMIARAIELENLQRTGVSTPEEDAEVEALRAIWARIKAIQVKSNELEAQYGDTEPTRQEWRDIAEEIRSQ